MIDSLKSELADLMQSRITWFLAGVFLSGQDVPSVMTSLRAFVGV